MIPRFFSIKLKRSSPYFTLSHTMYEYISSSDIHVYILIYFYTISMSVGWDAKLCPKDFDEE